MNSHDQDEVSLPWSPESETAVLGSLLLHTDTWDSVADLLEPRHFFDERHGRVFSAIASMLAASQPVDVITVLERLQLSGSAEGIDLQFLNSIAQYVASASNARQYARNIVDRALMRGLLAAADDVRTVATQPGLTVPQRLDKAQALVQALQVHRGKQEPVHASEASNRVLLHIEALETGTATPGISTNLSNLDWRLSGGFRPGKQVVIAARPSVGKSSLALQLSVNLALHGHASGFLSMEMQVQEQAERVVANIGGVMLDSIVTGKLSHDERQRVNHAVSVMRDLPLFFDDQPALTLQDISLKARKLKRQQNLKLLVVDYIQLCGGRGDRDKRHHQIEEISRGLKTLAKELEITVLTLSQLSRGVESRSGGKPMLSDLKESGAIEEDADVVMLLSVNQEVPGQAKVLEVDVAKNRQGKVGPIALEFDGAYQRWERSNEQLVSRKAAQRTYTEEA